MKTKILAALFLLTILGTNLSAQETTSPERFGNTLNVGLGLGYYGYVGHSIPVVHLNYEFNIANNFTLAPFVSLYSYRRANKYGYYYHETVIPIGAKGTYYFDQLLNAGSKWDFYAAGSLGFAIVNSRWDEGYYDEENEYRRSTPLYLDIHAGAEYHINNRIGVFLDLSTGVSTVGLAIH